MGEQDAILVVDADPEAALLLSDFLEREGYSVVAAATVVTYALYTVLGRDSRAFMVTIPIVIFGLFRYLLLVQRQAAGEEPEVVLLTDPPIIVAVVSWVLAAMVVPLVT